MKVQLENENKLIGKTLSSVKFGTFAVDEFNNFYLAPKPLETWYRLSPDGKLSQVTNSFEIVVVELPIGSKIVLTSER